MNKSVLLIIVFIFIIVSIAKSENYYCDPVNGDMNNAGTIENPWGSLQAVFAASKTFQEGDMIFLLSGAHGEPYISGTNTGYVTITAFNEEIPKIASVQIDNGSYWAFEGIDFTTDGSGGNFTRNYMISTNTTASYIKIENCNLYSAESSAEWSKADWYSNAENAVIIRGPNLIFNNNTIKNVYFAIEVRGDYSEIKNNLIDNFGADAVRILSSYTICENNIIRDAYIEDYNVNHDDAMQLYDYDNIYSGINKNVEIRNNQIFSFADPITQAMIDDDLIGYNMQGIITTDGHPDSVIVENNLVVSDHYHGITLAGAVECRIQNNTVIKTPISVNPDADALPWVQLRDDKQGNQSVNSIIRNNITTKLTPWTYPEELNTIENNIEIVTDDYIEYFVNSEEFILSLNESSLAVDAGINIDLSETDLAGNSRLSGNFVDCGAYEYNQSVTISMTENINAQIYPNPASQGRFFVKLPDERINAYMKIYSLNGKLVFNKMISEQISFNNTNLKPGSYLVSIELDEQIYYKKLMIY